MVVKAKMIDLSEKECEKSSGVELYLASKKHLFSDLNGESVVLSLENGTYYGFNSVGTFIWNCIQEPTSLDDLLESVKSAFEVDEETCRREVISFLERMEKEGLIERVTPGSD